MLYFIIFGFLFKLAAFPCHLWAPEVYDGSPHPVTAIFVLPIKIATFGYFYVYYIILLVIFILFEIILFECLLFFQWFEVV